jgi:hypothetical protein
MPAGTPRTASATATTVAGRSRLHAPSRPQSSARRCTALCVRHLTLIEQRLVQNQAEFDGEIVTALVPESLLCIVHHESRALRRPA